MHTYVLVTAEVFRELTKGCSRLVDLHGIPGTLPDRITYVRKQEGQPIQYIGYQETSWGNPTKYYIRGK